jgi:hypothetical protein
MRCFARLLAVGVVASFLTGCDSGSSIEEGAPKNVDMNKSYSPNVEMPGASVKDMNKAKAKPKGPADSAPAESK